jgi:imidazoleglycerol-phosphate dehydratase/histidinol-phosphatase
MKKVLFIDRDGTLIKEPIEDEQVDSLEKLEFIPRVFQALAHIVQNLDYELVIVTNQDGLGTESFPEDTFCLLMSSLTGHFRLTMQIQENREQECLKNL